jgi:uncharacterized protein (DUF2236 family)
MLASSPLSLPPFLERSLVSGLRDFLYPDSARDTRFLEPEGENALVSPGSVSWRIFKNPVALFIGGIAAVVLELAEPRVRTGVWQHTRFHSQPLERLRRTGLAAMATVYGPRSVSEDLIAHVVRRHQNVHGVTPAGQRYSANDPDLLTWVYATATFSFFEAYRQYVSPLENGNLDLLCQEGLPAAELYGAIYAPASSCEMYALFNSMQIYLESSPIVLEFLKVMQLSPIFPAIARPLQQILVRAAVDIVPSHVKQRLGLTDKWRLRPWESVLVRQMGRACDRVLIRSHPAVQSCLRLGLPEGYLYQHVQIGHDLRGSQANTMNVATPSRFANPENN